jgi:hypothetical protein
MESKEFQLIPNEIIEAWIRGEYYSSDLPSLPYKYIGISLALRGWYIYEARSLKEKVLKGVVKIDFKGSELFVGGMRLYTNQAGRICNLFWMSEFAHFLNENEIIWVYKIFNYDSGQPFFRRYLDDGRAESAKLHFDEDYFGLDRDAWNHMLDRIRTHLYEDLREVEADCERRECRIDKGLLHFFIREKRAQYRQIYSPEHTGVPIVGDSYYTRVSKQ